MPSWVWGKVQLLISSRGNGVNLRARHLRDLVDARTGDFNLGVALRERVSMSVGLF